MAVFLLVLSSTVSMVLAQGNQGGGPGNTQSPSGGLINPLCPANDPNCARSDAEGLLNSIVNWLLIIATPIAVGMILIGAFQMIFAGGDPEIFKNGKMTILYTAIGYGIILIGEGITLISKDLLSG